MGKNLEFVPNRIIKSPDLPPLRYLRTDLYGTILDIFVRVLGERQRRVVVVERGVGRQQSLLVVPLEGLAQFRVRDAVGTLHTGTFLPFSVERLREEKFKL